ncbi:hypothetical protein AB0L70_27405 [Kribbella sp. NPDC051952]|uniref:hypothetical protein n=1 Tax=Kribbella sp. NPDC051952 TaxID=3154851 RepID=UPI0034413DE5
MTVNGDIASPPEIDAGLAAAALAVFAHRHEVVHLLYAASDEADALARIGGLLRVDEATIARVLDQPLRWMLPQFRSELESIASAPAALTAPTAPTDPGLSMPTGAGLIAPVEAGAALPGELELPDGPVSPSALDVPAVPAASSVSNG